MDAQGSSPISGAPKHQPFPRGRLGGLDADVAATVVAAGGDIAMVIDRDGVICDMALSNDDLVRDGAKSWLDQRWSDTVSIDSRHKIDALLHDALRDGRTQWREVNQVTASQNSMMVRYLAVDAGREGHVIAIGRDDRETAQVQRRLLDVQQAVERDYSRLRDAESRYRLLFQMSGEAVIVVDAGTRRVIEANPAAERFVGEGVRLVGEPFGKLFDPDSRDEAAALLTRAQSTPRAQCAPLRLMSDRREFLASASLFRQDRLTQCLVRLTPADQVQSAEAGSAQRLQAVMDRMPDAFLVTDEALIILTANAAFLDLCRIPTQEQAVGQSLAPFLGRAGLTRNILVDNLRDHGSVRNFSTILRNQYDEPEDVEVSAVVAPFGPETLYGFSIRAPRQRQDERPRNPPELGRSVEQLTELVGRVKLKELVRETTDLVERLCIEAALELTKNNRASAAEVLGLSRQSLYSKLHRFGLGNLTDDEN